MEQLISAAEAADKWGISTRRVQVLCNEGRIEGARKQSGIWIIPSRTPRPSKMKSHQRTIQKKELRVLSLFSGCGGWTLVLRVILMYLSSL